MTNNNTLLRQLVNRCRKLVGLPPLYEYGDHLAKIVVQNHPYLGWVRGDAVIGGEAAALGLVDCETWDDGEVSGNCHGSVVSLKHFPNHGTDTVYSKPHTVLTVVEG